MKNVFLFVALLLSVSFSFANNNVAPNVLTTEVAETIKSENIDLISSVADTTDCSFPVYYDDGTDGSGDWGGSGSFTYSFECNSSTFWDDLFYMVNELFSGWQSIIIDMN